MSNCAPHYCFRVVYCASEETRRAIMSAVSRFKEIPMLYRIQSKLQTRLRDYETQMAKGSTSYVL